jgi:TctA family transporter
VPPVGVGRLVGVGVGVLVGVAVGVCVGADVPGVDLQWKAAMILPVRCVINRASGMLTLPSQLTSATELLNGDGLRPALFRTRVKKSIA